MSNILDGDNVKYISECMFSKITKIIELFMTSIMYCFTTIKKYITGTSSHDICKSEIRIEIRILKLILVTCLFFLVAIKKTITLMTVDVHALSSPLHPNSHPHPHPHPHTINTESEKNAIDEYIKILDIYEFPDIAELKNDDIRDDIIELKKIEVRIIEILNYDNQKIRSDASFDELFNELLKIEMKCLDYYIKYNMDKGKNIDQ